MNSLNAISRILVSLHPVHVPFFELILLVGNLVLATLTINERLIHPVLVVECGHFHSFGSVVVPKKLLHLTFARDLRLFEFDLVLLVHKLALLPIFLK